MFIVYDPAECGDDAYPRLWHRNDGRLDALIAQVRAGGAEVEDDAGIKGIVRAQAGHRCQRCRHPFRVGLSGVLEGAADELTEDLGVEQGVLDAQFAEIIAALPQSESDLAKAKRTNWSDCDGECRHGGPMRARGIGDWEYKEDATPGQVSLVASAGCTVQAAWRILTVHHLNGTKADLRWWNLTALCQRCHLLIQRKVVMERPWPYEHSPWFREHAAGFYAAKYLREDLTREETRARLDDLLALGEREECVERMPV